MKALAVALLALVAVACARKIDLEAVIDLEDITAYNYHTKVGIPLAEKIRKAEEVADQNPSRIVGGSASEPGQYPYQAGLIILIGVNEGVCGGSVVSPHKVITAAHCWFDGRNTGRSMTVVLGSTRLFSGGTRIVTRSVTLHQNWIPMIVLNDIAMVNLPTDVEFSSYIAPIALPSEDELDDRFEGAIAVASGFGFTRDREGISQNQFLSHIELPVISVTQCREYFPPVLIPTTTVCTSGAGGVGPCNGDSGGPLVIVNNNRQILIGATSFGSASGCHAGAPTVFTRITAYMSWINNNL